jgi:hypothetical protein
MRRDIFLYLSGPMAANETGTIEEHLAAGVKVYLQCLRRGLPAFCPHLGGFVPSAWTALSHAEWIAFDYAVLDRCTHLVQLPRWDTSRGARLETEYAIYRGIPIVSVAEAFAL